MQTRHRIPSIFNLSMVDVLCCALGCVILLWLVNFREAKRRAAAAGETAQQLTATRATLTSTQQKYDDTLAALTAARAQAAALGTDLQALQSRHDAAAAALLARNDENANLSKRMNATLLQMAALDKELLAKKTKLVTLNSDIEDLNGKLLASQELIKQLEKLGSTTKAEAKDYKDKLVLADARVLLVLKDLEAQKKKLSAADLHALELLAAKKSLEEKINLDEKELARMKLLIGDLKEGNIALNNQVKTIRLAAENRFAGMELTGKKVIFLIDISGSMRMRDSQTEAPEKWPQVCDTVGKLMGSLPDMTHYQVILFSDAVRYLSGGEGQWLPFKGPDSVRTFVTSLKRVTPYGGTKMAPAFAEAFRFRDLGLDTLYLISDGLPNDDNNLPPQVAQLPETQKTDYLSRQIRSKLRTTWNPRREGGVPVRINAVGFFFDSPDVGAFLWALTRENNGSFVGMSRP